MGACDVRNGYAGLALGEAVRSVSRTLAAAGVDAAGVDARRLVAAAIGGTGLDLLREPERVLSRAEAGKLDATARRRAAREPLSRILGRRDFFGRTFRVSPATLDPRPCSETLVEAALAIADEEGWRERPIRILDVGTGSGCLLLTLLAELPLAQGLATDISSDALAIARENAGRMGLAARVRFEERRYLDGMSETHDLLVSNPPYIPSGEIGSLEPEVRDHEPLTALDGGADGLEAYRALAGGLSRVVPSGWTVLEVGAGQSEAVARIFLRTDPGCRPPAIKLWKDLAGHIRCVSFKSQP